MTDNAACVGTVAADRGCLSKPIPAGISNRHLHLSKEHFKTLYGADAEPTLYRPITQPGFYACNECFTLETEKGKFENVRMIGPYRPQTQIEISISDAIKLGLKPPVRDSGKLENTPGLKITGPKGSITLLSGVIISKRHIHFSPADAQEFGVKDGQIVSVRCGRGGERELVFGQVLCRVSDKFKLELHVDVEEANSAMIKNGDSIYIEPAR
ncbi:MAG: phosphate propanoyltransferase [Elusimicrobiales bacterium]